MRRDVLAAHIKKVHRLDKALESRPEKHGVRSKQDSSNGDEALAIYMSPSLVLLEACANGGYFIIKKALNGDAIFGLTSHGTWGALIASAGRGQHEIVKMLVRYGNRLDGSAWWKTVKTVLREACTNGHTDTIDILTDSVSHENVHNNRASGWRRADFSYTPSPTYEM